MTGDGIAERLAAHRLLGGLPSNEIEWLAAHGTLATVEAGSHITTKGAPITQMYVLFTGAFAIHVNRGAGPRKVMEWRGGDIAGLLPFSRMTNAPGDSVVSETVEALMISREHFPEMIRECPQLAALVVHTMVDRARHFASTDMMDEKMVSLGRLTAGVAHELNNPASAAARSAKLLLIGLVEADNAARLLGAARLSAEQTAAIDEVRAASLEATPTVIASPLEMADREDEIADWCVRHHADPAVAHALSNTWVTLDALDGLAEVLPSDTLTLALAWIAAGTNVRSLAAEIERAATRVHDLVMSMKRTTHMDRAAVIEAVDVGLCLTDALALQRSKARDKGASVVMDIPADLPRVAARSGELSVVWSNLLENALYAVGEVEGKREVRVTARAEPHWVVVCIRDNGPGIPADIVTRIFDPFFTTKPVGEGTGLGLDSVQKIVRSHNGEIDVTSVPGRTEFRVALPVA
jgi:signal transduction histidine kinase